MPIQMQRELPSRSVRRVAEPGIHRVRAIAFAAERHGAPGTSMPGFE
ncbi:hypothetical protein [Sphingomonas faeni]